MYNAANNAVGILTAPIDSTSTEMTVNNGAVFPEPPFVVTLYDRYHNVEIIEVRAKNGDIFSELVRGAEGTISREWPMQTRVENRWTAGTYARIMDSIGSKWEWDASAIMGVKVNSAKNADTVNNLAVETAVPPNAKFTDTIYTHPATHSADMIIENAARRFVSDSDISAWNAKEDSSNKGKADGYASLDANAKIPLSQLPDVSKQQTYIVSSPTEREALTGLITGDKCYETTTGDSYIWGGTGWLLLAAADWENINLDWTNIVNKPASSVASIDDAVTKKHAHTNKAVLDAVSSAGSGAIITSEERTKLASIEDGANKYTHPSTHSADMIIENSTRRFVSDSEKLIWNSKPDTDTVTTINGKTGAISKADIVALGIPAQDTVYTHPPGTNPHGTTKSDVGLGNVDNVKQASKTEFDEHLADDVSQGEIHGLRVENDKLEYYTGTEWKIASGGIPVGNVSGLSAKEDNAEITLMWTDPDDRYLDDLKIAEWQGTKIVRKEGSYPVSDDDGTLVVDNKTRNQYSTNGYKDTGLTNEVTYYYMAFPYTEDAITVDGANRISATPTAIDPNSWGGIQKIVRQGLANEFFSVGDQLVSEYDGGEIIWEVIGIDVDTPADSQYTHSMTIQTKDCLHNIQFDAKEPNNPDSSRRSYGNNRYTHSAIRQWLNSEDEIFNWQSQHQYDAKPTSSLDLYNGAGFLYRLDPELVSVLGAVNKKVALNTATDGGGQESFNDKVFLLSQKEVGLGEEGDVTGEFVYPFYDGITNAGRIKQLNGNNRHWWLRSPYVSNSYYVRYVNTDGSLYYISAYYAIGVSPACVII